MKIRESGMPARSSWEAFFNSDLAISKLLGPKIGGDVVEMGCGYGTFTLPAARRTSGKVLALDIEPAMIATVEAEAARSGVHNVRAEVRDFLAHGTGLGDGTQAAAMAFNVLHLARPERLLREVHRVLQAGGVLAILHWRSDIATPRGPPKAIRPTPNQCRRWLADAGFGGIHDVDLGTCCPFHFGLVARRQAGRGSSVSGPSQHRQAGRAP